MYAEKTAKNWDQGTLIARDCEEEKELAKGTEKQSKQRH